MLPMTLYDKYTLMFHSSVAVDLDKTETSGNLKVVSEKSGKMGKVRENGARKVG